MIGCGAIARELLDVVRRNGLDQIEIECLPGLLHNRPEKIPAAVVERIERALPHYDRIFVGYADCGTGGLLDAALARYKIERLPGSHCYEFFAGTDLFDQLQEEELGTFYLTDYLARHFQRLVWEGLGLERELIRQTIFANYRRVVYLSQVDDPALLEEARSAARRLGLSFEHRSVGLGLLEPSILGSIT